MQHSQQSIRRMHREQPQLVKGPSPAPALVWAWQTTSLHSCSARCKASNLPADPDVKTQLLQGVSQEFQPRLVAAMARAAARYGHVMHPEIATEPAVELAQKLLSSAGRGWADRVFYSDDGCVPSVHVCICEDGLQVQHPDCKAAWGACLLHADKGGNDGSARA